MLPINGRSPEIALQLPWTGPGNLVLALLFLPFLSAVPEFIGRTPIVLNLKSKFESNILPNCSRSLLPTIRHLRLRSSVCKAPKLWILNAENNRINLLSILFSDKLFVLFSSHRFHHGSSIVGIALPKVLC